MNTIELKGINKRYVDSGNVTKALNDVSLEITKGELIAIMGPSGSGKSTLLNIIGCLDTATEGDYFINGQKVSLLKGDGLAEVRNKSIGFVFQQFNLIKEYTIRENLELPLIYGNIYHKGKDKLSKKEIEEKVKKALEAVGLWSESYKKPTQLSGGQQQRVAIARALINSPEIVIADEPTGALDQENGKKVMEILKEINNAGTTVIIVTHDQSIADYCNRKIKLMDGRILTDSKLMTV